MIDLIDKIWLKKNKKYRILLSVIFFGCSLFSLIYLRNILLGSLFLFLVAYFLGSFERRNNVVIINNKDIPTAIREIKKLIDMSKHSVEILTLSLNPVIYSNDEVLESFKNAIARHVKVVVACNYDEFRQRYSEYYSKNNQQGFLKFLINENIVLFNVKKGLNNINHFIVVDDISFRLEELHENDTEKGRKATIVYFSSLARGFHENFNNIINDEKLSEKIRKAEIETIISNNI